MNIKYEDAIKIISASGKTETERADNLIKEMCRLTNDLLDYRYVAENCKTSGGSTVIADSVMRIKNSMALVMSDMDILMEQFGIADKVRQKAVDRVNRIADKIERG